ncbi:YggS family pyridoxal phosphate-dependent enzyme [uncultured Pseudoteredinibacter sp.]|uniref:YggS family pyridoxal phosphate-dependent enzyme n=1 Tax=uncultured Pseudoteredinibacter sp. TaxID=1641701 RepID=UPI00262E5E84|nr:YggS family pyridoxal phosphate-dependent enzyme [uncultured Pseudoteredinibacter sp.]
MLEAAETVAERLKIVQSRINEAASQSGRMASDIQLLAVSKTKPLVDILQAYHAGQIDFGENYLQEALQKQEELAQLNDETQAANDICWHFIGPIQSNKTRAIAENFSWVHSIDRLKIAQRLSQQRDEQQPELNICLQVNLDNEESKSGFSPQELQQQAMEISKLPKLKLRGLMAIPKPRQEYSEQLHSLQRLRQLQQELNKAGLKLDTLSMGMSQDLAAAVAAGSTMLRVGSDIFGPRS